MTTVDGNPGCTRKVRAQTRKKDNITMVILGFP